MCIVTYPGRLLCSQHPWGVGGGGGLPYKSDGGDCQKF